jgi:hypothetical protein
MTAFVEKDISHVFPFDYEGPRVRQESLVMQNSKNKKPPTTKPSKVTNGIKDLAGLHTLATMTVLLATA